LQAGGRADRLGGRKKERRNIVGSKSIDTSNKLSKPAHRRGDNRLLRCVSIDDDILFNTNQQRNMTTTKLNQVMHVRVYGMTTAYPVCLTTCKLPQQPRENNQDWQAARAGVNTQKEKS
jgi:hypothetical protein